MISLQQTLFSMVKKMKAFSLRSERRHGCSLLSLLIQYSFGSPSHGNQEQKEIKGIQIGKEVKLSVFADDMRLHTENPKYITKKLANQLI